MSETAQSLEKREQRSESGDQRTSEEENGLPKVVLFSDP